VHTPATGLRRIRQHRLAARARLLRSRPACLAWLWNDKGSDLYVQVDQGNAGAWLSYADAYNGSAASGRSPAMTMARRSTRMATRSTSTSLGLRRRRAGHVELRAVRPRRRGSDQRGLPHVAPQFAPAGDARLGEPLRSATPDWSPVTAAAGVISPASERSLQGDGGRGRTK
jgi:hypothetical protein